MEFEYIRAEDLDRAWLNFEPTVTLDPMPDGRPNPFYVDRPGNPTAQLEDALLAPFLAPPKYFFSGHKGCGKSTELRRLAANPEIRQKYYPIHFTIRDEADINDLDYKDVLLALGRQMYQQYTARGGKLRDALEKELENWRGKVSEEFVRSSRLAGFEISGGVDALAAQFGLKMKLEPQTRRVLRQVIEPNVKGLVDVINLIAAEIQAHEKRMPLILIDDLDKPDLAIAREIFYAHLPTMRQPNCAIVYTLSSALFYSTEFKPVGGEAKFLPNVRLHTPDGKQDDAGWTAMREFAHRRMAPELIEPDALDEALRLSGGVFSETARLMRAAIQRARRSRRVQREHVQGAVTELRSEYRRMLLEEKWRRILIRVHNTHRLSAANPEESEIIGKLLQILALLEYNGDGSWWDVHPALIKLLEEYESSGAD